MLPHWIWLRATPQEHLSRVIAQGDMRPMVQHPEAMSDIERILSEREQLYLQADIAIDTSGKSIEQVLKECADAVRRSREAGTESLSQRDRLGSQRLPV